jgi:hypothetical protein
MKWLSIIPLLFLFACDLEKEIEVKLPPFKSELVGECYLERDKPFKLYLSETDSYFDTLRFVIVNDASVRVIQDFKTDTIPNYPFLDFFDRKLYNYVSDFPLELDTTKPFRLEIRDPKGKVMTGTTQFLPIPDIDTIEVRYDPESDSLAGFLIWINDFPGQDNYYRIIMNEDSLNGPPAVEFTFTDNQLDGKRFPLGTSYRFKRGKKMHIRIFHIEKTWYDYLRSISAANRANGNPFAQPATVKSPMEGGYGIFTTLNFRQYLIPL